MIQPALIDVAIADAVAEVLEEWRDVEGADGYQVSNLGRVRSYRTKGRFHTTPRATPLVLQEKDNSRGYKYVGITWRDGVKKRNIAIHRLVALTFLPNPEARKTVNHIDGDKANNRADNLEWMSHEQNMNHASLNNLLAVKVSSENIREMKSLRAQGRSYVDIAVQFNICPTHARRIILGLRRKNEPT